MSSDPAATTTGPGTAICTLPHGALLGGIAEGLAARGWSIGAIGVGAAPDDLVDRLRSIRTTTDAGTAGTGSATVHGVGCEFDSREGVVAAVDEVARALVAPPRLLVHGFPLYPAMAPRPLLDINEAGWTMVCESTMKAALLVLQAAFGALAPAGRVVLVLPTFAMSGAESHVALATAAEGVRALAKSAARQWGADGITVNTIAVDPGALLGEASIGAPDVSLAVPALELGEASVDLAPVVDWLSSADAHAVTGQTVVLDGGVWLAS